MCELLINFDDFINNFYSNTSHNKIIFNINIENATNDTPTTIYDIHMMLLDLLIKGIQILNLDILGNNYEKSLNILQKYFSNINIKININNFTKKDLIETYSEYSNRFIKFEDPSNMIINGTHEQETDLSNIKSFYLINLTNNLSISFKYQIFD